jgi:hypothetical protein
MATTFKWVAPEAIATAHSTSLNSLGSGSLSAASSTIDNETDLYEFLNLEVVLASLTPTGSPSVNIWASYSTDGTNFDDGSTSEMELLAVLPLSTSASTKRVSRGNIPIRPLKFQIYVENKSNVAFAAASNTVKYRRTNLQGV